MKAMDVRWIAVDWGTTNLSVWAINSADEVVDSASSASGMSKLQPDEFEGALLNLISPWLLEEERAQIVACGMVGAKQGWREVPYTTCPVNLRGTSVPSTLIETKDKRFDLHIVHGLACADPHSVMRGEETQIAGFLSQNPSFEGLICLPGTHSKWVTVENGVVMHFETFMTGELYELLTTQSVLRHSFHNSALDEPTFDISVQESAADPRKLFKSLFSIRAQSLLTQTTSSVLIAKVSGLLIGQELGLALEAADNCQIALIASGRAGHRYQRAFAALNVDAQIVNSDEVVLAGLQGISRQTSGGLNQEVGSQ